MIAATRWSWLPGLALASPLLVASCGSPSAPPPGSDIDAGTDAATDAPTDSPADAPADAPAEAGPCALISPYSTKNQPCNACAEEKCCAEVNGCIGDPVCNDDFVNCELVCAFDYDAGPDAAADAGPTDCLAACAAQYPKGKMEYDLAIGCVEQACPVECQ